MSKTFDEELREILDRHQNAYSIAYSEINPHENYPDSNYDGTKAVMKRSTEISSEALEAIKTLIKKHQPRQAQPMRPYGNFVEGWNAALEDSDRAYNLEEHLDE